MHDTSQFFPAFEEEVNFWVKRFGLFSWDLEIYMATADECPDLGKSWAICRAKQHDRTADIVLNAEWESAPTEKQVRRTAFHEVCELLLFRLYFLAFDPKASVGDWEEENHCVIRIMENAVWEQNFTIRGRAQADIEKIKKFQQIDERIHKVFAFIADRDAVIQVVEELEKIKKDVEDLSLEKIGVHA